LLPTAFTPAPENVQGCCEHCRLPAPPGERFCCYGCELAAELAREAAQNESRLKGILTLCLLLSMAVMMLSLFLYAEDVYGATDSLAMARLRDLYRVMAAILSTPVVLLCGVPLLRRALARIKQRQLSMDLLVGAGAFAAYGLSMLSIAKHGSRVYFDSATSALMLSTLGRYLEAVARARASQLLGSSLARAGRPTLAFDPDSGEFQPRAPGLIVPGTRLRIDVEQALPVDAELVGSAAEVNLAVLSGEAAPLLLHPGERIPAGAIPVSGPIECVAESSVRDSTLERLAEMARRLRERASSLQRWADRFAAVLAPLVWILAVLTLAHWWSVSSLEQGVVTALAVVLAACPCTYGIIVPLTLWLALRRALEQGVLLRDASALEQLAHVECVAFDKTGTLTTRLALARVEVFGAAVDEVLAIAASMEQGSPHPIAQALVRAAAGARSIEVCERRFMAGKGVSAKLPNGDGLFLGVPEQGSDAEAARCVLSRNGTLVGKFYLAETIRSEAEPALQALRVLGVRPVILTGDREPGARSVARTLNVPVIAQLSAAQKARWLDRLGKQVAMVGDGLNDAPALAKAPSFAIGEGSDLARGMSRVTLLRSDLRLVPWTLALARRTLRTVRRCLAVSTVYNLSFLALAATGALKPVWAGLSMLTSSLLTLGMAQRMSAVPGVPSTTEAATPEAMPVRERSLHAPMVASKPGVCA